MADRTQPPTSSAPMMPGQPYDATAPDGSMLGPWVKLPGGICNPDGSIAGDWPDSAPWQQC